MALTPHMIRGANTNTGGGFTPDTIAMFDGFTGRTVLGPATITRIILDAQFIEGLNPGKQVIDPSDFQNTYGYIVSLTLWAPGTPAIVPVLTPLLDPTNDILHYGLLNKDNSPMIPGMRTSEKPIIIETQRKVPAGVNGGLWLSWNCTNPAPVVQLIANLIFFVVYLTP